MQNNSWLLPCSAAGCPHEAQVVGATMSSSAPVRAAASSTPATNGMTSPARRTSAHERGDDVAGGAVTAGDRAGQVSDPGKGESAVGSTS
nr:hypothetical protein [Nocardia tengchongensis]